MNTILYSGITQMGGMHTLAYALSVPWVVSLSISDLNIVRVERITIWAHVFLRWWAISCSQRHCHCGHRGCNSHCRPRVLHLVLTKWSMPITKKTLASPASKVLVLATAVSHVVARFTQERGVFEAEEDGGYIAELEPQPGPPFRLPPHQPQRSSL